MSKPAGNQPVECVILVNLKEGVSEQQLNIVAQQGSFSLCAEV
jgi:hypothetical protein